MFGKKKKPFNPYEKRADDALVVLCPTSATAGASAMNVLMIY